MFPDFKDLLSALNAHSVRYLIVGDYAVSLHAQPRTTKDLDIFVGHDPDNAIALHAALTEFGAPLDELKAADLCEKDSFFRMGSPPMMVDILPDIAGVEFEAAWDRRVNCPIEDGLIAFFIAPDDLLASKVAAGRPQDMADVAALRAARSDLSS